MPQFNLDCYSAIDQGDEMKTMIAFLTGFAFLVGCQSSVNQEKPPEWSPMTRTEMAKSPFKSPADQYLAMKYFQDRPATVPKKGPLPGN